MINLKNIIIGLVLVSAVMVSAAGKELTNVKIDYYRYHTLGGTSGWQGESWFGTTQKIDGCPTWSKWTIIAVSAGDNQAISTILTAKNTGKPINLKVDTSVKLHNYCQLQWISLM